MSYQHTTEDEPLKDVLMVYEFRKAGEVQMRTISSKKFDEFLKSEFSELPPRKDYEKIQGVNIEERTFREVRENGN